MDLVEYRDDLVRRRDSVLALAKYMTSPNEVVRLRNKADGIQIAIDLLDSGAPFDHYAEGCMCDGKGHAQGSANCIMPRAVRVKRPREGSVLR